MSIPYPTTRPNWIPNPLDLLPSDPTQQINFATDVNFVVIGSLSWDMLVSLPEDMILLKSGFRPVLIAYFLSRICALGYLVQLIAVNIYPVSHCIAIGYAATICWVVASASGATLLFQRAKMVYRNSRNAQWAFFLLLMMNIAITLLVPLSARFKELPVTRYCADRGFRGYAAAALIARLVYSSCVFFAICLRVITMKGVSGEPLSWRTLLSSSRVVRALFGSGQQYYMIIICSNVLVVIVTFLPSHSVPIAYKIISTVPDIALSSSMACRVFRNLKITTDKIDSAMSELVSSSTANGNVITINSKHRRSSAFGSASGSEVGLGSFGAGFGLGLGMGPMGHSRTSLSMISLRERERLDSSARTVDDLPPVPPLPGSHTGMLNLAHTSPHPHPQLYGHGRGHLRSSSATSLTRLRDDDHGERYSILKVRPIGDSAANGTITSTSSTSTTTCSSSSSPTRTSDS